jgi:hypothetical protein
MPPTGSPRPAFDSPRACRVLLGALLVAATLYKIAAFERAPRFDPHDDTCLFWTESAFHYRYARMVGLGESIPALDRDVQFPEGMRVFREETVVMEYAAGLTFRVARLVAPGLPFHRWLVWFVCAFSSLSIAAAFLAGRALWGSRAAGLVAAFAYGLSPFSFNRLIGNYGREDFALPILFLSFAAFVASLREGPGRRRRFATRGALFLAAGLASWHVSRFYATFFFVALAPIGLALATDREGFARTLRVAVAALLAAGALVPVLREKAFLLSPGFLVAVALLVAAEASWRRGLARGRSIALFAAIAVVLFGAASLFPTGERDYSHVTGLAVEKIRHLGKKPTDPAALPYDARVLWVEAFESPSLASMLIAGSTLLAWGAIALALGARRLAARRLDAAQAFAVVFAFLFTGLYLLLDRFSPFAVFFVAAILPVVLPPSAPRRTAVLALLALTAALQISYDLRFDRDNPWRRSVLATFPPRAPKEIPNFGNNVRLVRWMRRHAPERAVTLTWYPTGPMVLTDTWRPINLHSKFESRALRDKERRMIEALYGDREEDFFRLCSEFQSDLFVYQANLLLDRSSSSSRYMADRMILPTTSPAFLFHYRPEALRHFTLIYQDGFYRVFRVHEEGEEVFPPAPIAYEEMFDPSVLGANPGATFDDRATGRTLGLLLGRINRTQDGVDLVRRQARAQAEAVFREVLRASPDCADALAQLALLVSEAGRTDEARFLISRALTTHPDYPELHTVRGVILERAGLAEEAAAAYRQALEIAPGYDLARRHLARVGRKP